MTLSKLARLANVSVSVVSKAFAGKEGVSEAMREHVFAVAKEHGCFEQFYHVPYDKPVIAVIIPEAISVYYIHYIEILKKSMEAHGYTMLLSISNFDPEMAEELVRYYTEHSNVNGIVFFGDIPNIKKQNGIAVVTVNDNAMGNIGTTVIYDLTSGLIEAIRQLKALGHRRIAYVGEPLTPLKLTVMTDIMKSEDMDIFPELMICSLHRFEEAGRDGASRLLALQSVPTAIFGSYGYITRGIISELESRGISIPNDISVISMDNDPSQIHPHLSVSHIPSGTEKVCDRIMYALQKQITEKTFNADAIYVESDFYLGNTVSVAKL